MLNGALPDRAGVFVGKTGTGWRGKELGGFAMIGGKAEFVNSIGGTRRIFFENIFYLFDG